MNGALPPNRYELFRNSLSIGLPLADRLELPLGRPLVELARAADLVFRIGDHLLPLRDPADGAREGEDAGKHRHRDAEGALDDARIEVDVRIQLAAHEVVVLERDLLERERQLEDAIV